jgi:hypothetical protein
MNPTLERKPIGAARFLFKHPLPLESETSWFLLLGVADLVVTFLLLRTGAANESNPLARMVLLAGGLRGLIYYKCALLAVVAVLVQGIALKHPTTARTVLHVGIAAQWFVVVYGGGLLLRALL